MQAKLFMHKQWHVMYKSWNIDTADKLFFQHAGIGFKINDHIFPWITPEPAKTTRQMIQHAPVVKIFEMVYIGGS